MSGNVYLIVKGACSDYVVIAASLDRQVAVEQAARLTRIGVEDVRVEPLQLVGSVHEPLCFVTYVVDVDQAGEKIYETDFVASPDGYTPFKISGPGAVRGFGRSPEAALQAARDFLAGLKAQAEGL